MLETRFVLADLFISVVGLNWPYKYIYISIYNIYR